MRSRSRCKRLEQHVRALDQLRLEALVPADSVLLERADDERCPRQPEGLACPDPLLGRSRVEHVDVDPDRDPVDFRRVDSRLQHDRLHVGVRDLDPVDVGMPAPQRVEAGVELGHSGGPRATVEVRDAEVVAALLKVLQEQREVAQMEDRLICDAVRPTRGPEPDAQLIRGALELARLVRQDPAGRLALDKKARVRRPGARANDRRGAPDRPPHRRRESPERAHRSAMLGWS